MPLTRTERALIAVAAVLTAFYVGVLTWFYFGGQS